MEIINLRPLSQVEIEGNDCTFLSDVFSGSVKSNFQARLGDELFERAISGGFPEPLLRGDFKRQRAWHSNYLNVMSQKDITEFSNIHYAE